MNLAPTAGPDTEHTQGEPAEQKPSQWSPGFLERQFFKVLSKLKHGIIELEYSGQILRFGTPANDHLLARVKINNRRFFREVSLGGSLGAAESYLQGDWTTDQLTTLLRIMCRNLDSLAGMDTGLAQIGLWLAKLAHRSSHNSKAGSQRNIAAHYDLSNEFFKLFLDPTMMYSSALYRDELQSLEDASLNKLDEICRQLDLGPDDHVVEIGTGWGGFAIHAAQNYGCRVTTTTISKNQFDVARERVVELNLENQIELLLKDYRDLSGTYDKLVSIEMIEAVGHQYLPTYFSTCNCLLKPNGKMLVQAITMPDQRYQSYLKQTDFIQKYIFPGGHLPSIGAMQGAQNLQNSLRLVNAQQFPDSYAYTLREWRRRFFALLDEVKRLGFDERFINMWNYYMCYCEAAFLERSVSVGQFVWQKAEY